MERRSKDRRANIEVQRKDSFGLVLLLKILEKRDVITQEERSDIVDIQALTELLESTGRIPPVGEEEILILKNWHEIALKKSVTEKRVMLNDLILQVKSDQIRSVLCEIYDLLDKVIEED